MWMVARSDAVVNRAGAFAGSDVGKSAKSNASDFTMERSVAETNRGSPFGKKIGERLGG